MGLFKKGNKTTTQKGGRIPKNVMESIPYKWVNKNGIFEDYDGRFSKTYRILDTNFDTEEDEQQEKMVLSDQHYRYRNDRPADDH